MDSSPLLLSVLLLLCTACNAFTLTQCSTTTDCPCTGQPNGTTNSIIPSDQPTWSIQCGWDANGNLNGAKCMGGRCLCAPGWWSYVQYTPGSNTVRAECALQMPNSTFHNGTNHNVSNLHVPLFPSQSYYWNSYMPVTCGCNEALNYNEGLFQGWSGFDASVDCPVGEDCQPGCRTFNGCFFGQDSACEVYGARADKRLHILPALSLNPNYVIHPAIGPDPAWISPAEYGINPAITGCVVTIEGNDQTLGFNYCKPGFCSVNCCPCDLATGVVCGGVGLCLNTGDCSCPTGYNGTYCCPIGNNGTVCGPYGTCLSDGTCSCGHDFLGLACQSIDTRCPTDTPSFSCSGIGTCEAQTSFDNCLATLNYYDDPAIQLAQFSPPITDEGIWNTVVDLWLTFKLTDISESTDRTYFNQYLSACQGNANETACVLHLWVSEYNNTDATIDGMGLRHSVATYILDAFAAFHPELAGISGNFLATLVPLINATYLNPSLLYQGEAALLCYTQYINWLDMSLTATFPTYPIYGCQCTSVTTGTVGSTMLPAGPDCASSCPLGKNGVVCSGYFEGQFEGVCSPSPGADVCICDPRFAGNACQFDLIGQCYPPFSNEVQPCTASSHGDCYLTNPLASNQIYACNCSDTWRGTYCQFTRCAPNGVDQTTECSGNGICQDPSFTCSCDINRFLGGCQPSTFPSVSECTGAELCLPVGSQCEQNGIAECGVFTLNTGACGSGQGFWTSCNNHGVCTAQTAPALPRCVCASGFSGSLCQFEDCNPGCNSHSTCNTGDGQCVCETMWSSPSGCTNSSLSCFCSQNLCVHGEPDANGTNCDCDSGWAKDGSGYCTVVQCPFIIETNQGEIPCLPANSFCPNTNGLIPSNQQFSLDNGCCINTCPTCQLNTTTNVRTCICANNIQYVQSGGICFSVCHGQPSSIVGQTAVCDCSGLTVQSNQFINSFCEIFTCLNGGTPDGTGGCTCSSVFTGQFCATPNCGNNGLVNINSTGCDCFPPYTHSPPSSPLCNGNSCGGDGTVLTLGPDDYQCSCASDHLIGPLSESCIALNCSLPSQQPTCALCLHGSQPYIISNMIACNCSGTGYAGVQCGILVSTPSTGSAARPSSTVLLSSSGTSSTGINGNPTASSSSVHSSSTATASHHSSASATSGSSSTSASTTGSSTGSSGSSSGISSTAANVTSSSSSSTAVAVTAPSSATGLSNLEFYGAIFGSIGGALVLTATFTILAWQLGWGVFAKAGATAATDAASTAAAAAASDASGEELAGALPVGARAKFPPEERFPLVGTRPPSTRRY